MLSELTDEIYARIEALSDDDLHQLIRECETVTEANSWWVKFRLAPHLEAVARNEVKLRADKPKQDA